MVVDSLEIHHISALGPPAGFAIFAGMLMYSATTV